MPNHEDNTNRDLPAQNIPLARLHLDSQTLPLKILNGLIIVELVLVFLDAVMNYGALIDSSPLRRLFNIAREDGIATWFMVSQTLIAGLLLWLTLLVRRGQGAERKEIIGWSIIASFFTYMSADDASKIHERMGTAFSEVRKASMDSGTSDGMMSLLNLFPSYDWQIVALPLLAGTGLFMLYFLWQRFEDNYGKKHLLLAVGIMGLAVVLDFIEGLDETHAMNIYIGLEEIFELQSYTVSHFAKALEEFLEMASISILLMLFIRHLMQIGKPELVIEIH